MKLVLDTNLLIHALGGSESFDGSDGGSFPVTPSTGEARIALRTIMKSASIVAVLSYAVRCETAKLAVGFGYSQNGVQTLDSRLRTFVESFGGVIDTVGHNVPWETWRKAFVSQQWPTGAADAAVLYTAKRLGADIVTYDGEFSFQLNILGRGDGVRAIHPRDVPGLLQPA